MRLRSFALMLALLVAATPVMGVVCATDCERPVATASSCHEASAAAPQDVVTLRQVLHSCDHDHSGASPGLAATGERDPGRTSAVAQAPMAARAILPQAYAASAVRLHGPTELTPRNSLSHSTILRI